MSLLASNLFSRKKNGFHGNYLKKAFCILPVALLTAMSASAQGPAEHQSAGSAVVGQGHTKALVGSLTSFDTDGDNALNIGDYGRAQEVFASRIKSLSSDQKGTFTEVGLRAGLFEALLWQGNTAAAAAELKRIHKVLDPLSTNLGENNVEQVNMLNARVLDAQSWLEEGQGQRDQAMQTLNKAISLLKVAGVDEHETWRLVTCMGHLASLQAGMGAYNQAAQLLQEALGYAKNSPSIAPLNIADIEEQLGSMLFKQGRADEANQHFAIALAMDNATGAVQRKYSPKPYWLCPTYTYTDGSPWSTRSFQDGLQRKRITLDAVAVEAVAIRDNSAQSKGKVVKVALTVLNRTNASLDFMGRKPELIAMTPKAVVATMIEPLKLADNVEKKAQSKAKWVRFWGQDATQTLTSTYINQPSYGYGYGGFYPPVMSYGGTIPTVMRNGNMTTMMTQVPDYAAQQRAMEKARAIEDDGKAYADQIRSQSLGPCDIAGGASITGAVFFQLDDASKAGSCIVRIPIGDATFEFTFDKLVGN
ncbi:MAG: tetratricopeptide repeat protein [Candidatus Obscuribacterales bacterium]|jgi:tetratricopeptide (TPR) repeat protein